jgi:hypothetical protein
MTRFRTYASYSNFDGSGSHDALQQLLNAWHRNTFFNLSHRYFCGAGWYPAADW